MITQIVWRQLQYGKFTLPDLADLQQWVLTYFGDVEICNAVEVVVQQRTLVELQS